MDEKFKKVYELLGQIDGEIVGEAIELIEMIELEIEEIKDEYDTLERRFDDYKESNGYFMFM